MQSPSQSIPSQTIIRTNLNDLICVTGNSTVIYDLEIVKLLRSKRIIAHPIGANYLN